MVMRSGKSIHMNKGVVFFFSVNCQRGEIAHVIVNKLVFDPYTEAENENHFHYILIMFLIHLFQTGLEYVC